MCDGASRAGELDRCVAPPSRLYGRQVMMGQLREGVSDAPPSREAAEVGARLHRLLRGFLASSPPPWALLGQRLLHQLSDAQLLRLMRRLAARTPLRLPRAALAAPPPAGAGAGGGGLWAEAAGVCGEGPGDLRDLALAGGVEWNDVGQAVRPGA
jgi:hypothetical protein